MSVPNDAAPDRVDDPDTHKPRSSQEFVARVLTLCEDNATRAALRSGLGRPVEQCNRLHRYLVQLTSPRLYPESRRAHYAVAALIAARPRDPSATGPGGGGGSQGERGEAIWSWRDNLGASLAEAVKKGALAPNSAEGELHLITRQGTAAIHSRLPALTRHLLGKGVPINWALLLEDLSWWDRDRDRVATRWLESYFRTLHTSDESGQDPKPIPTDHHQ